MRVSTAPRTTSKRTRSPPLVCPYSRTRSRMHAPRFPRTVSVRITSARHPTTIDATACGYSPHGGPASRTLSPGSPRHSACPDPRIKMSSLRPLWTLRRLWRLSKITPSPAAASSIHNPRPASPTPSSAFGLYSNRPPSPAPIHHSLLCPHPLLHPTSRSPFPQRRWPPRHRHWSCPNHLRHPSNSTPRLRLLQTRPRLIRPHPPHLRGCWNTPRLG